MWEAITVCTSIFTAWLLWEDHKRKKEEHEAKYRRGERESRSFTFPEIAPSQPPQKHKFFMFTEIDDCLCGVAYWFLWSTLWLTIFLALDPTASENLGSVVFILILGIPLGRYLQKKVQPLLKWFK